MSNAKGGNGGIEYGKTLIKPITFCTEADKAQIWNRDRRGTLTGKVLLRQGGELKEWKHSKVKPSTLLVGTITWI